MGRESALQGSALRYLNALPKCKAENVSGNAHQSGRPDINGCYRGRMFKFELKTPDDRNTASKKQKLELRKWGNAGCVIGVIYSLNVLREAIQLMSDQTHLGLYEWEDENECKSWIKIPPM